MPEFKKNNRFSGGGHSGGFDRGGRPPFRGGGRDFGGPKEMFDAECANCHKMTQVPFKPNGMKPVYCRDCFKPSDDRGPRDDRGGRDSFPKRDFAPRREFAPAAPRPDGRIDELKRQMDTMNATLQRLVTVIEAGNRKTELGNEVRKAIAPAAKPAAKKTVKKAKKSK